MSTHERPLPPTLAQPGHGPVVVLGGPGTGKSTLALDLVTTRLQAGLDAARVQLLVPTRLQADRLRDELALTSGVTFSEPVVRTYSAYAFDLLRRALVLLADHELNVSTFAARVTASGGASLHHATLAGLCALQGPKHGLAVLDAADLLGHAAQVGAGPALRDAVRRHGSLPGFGHKLYPAGDVRAAALFCFAVVLSMPTTRCRF